MREKEILVVGIGNEILTDDGIGPKLIHKLRNTYQYPGVTFINTCLGGLDMLDVIRDYKQVIVIDAIKTEGGKPGSVYHLTLDDFKETMHISNVHDISFLTAIELGKKLQINIPEVIDIIAIEIVEDLVFAENFSPEIQKNFSTILKTVEKYLHQILRNINQSYPVKN